ncbi:MAG: lysine--tRNA ligase [Thermoprotei archaeon]|nr:MAG: lysine--tRNA ligase [Thermoprotei archaeon]
MSWAHWVDKLADEVASLAEAGYVSEPIVLNGGLSVSGLQHVGRLRGEVVLVSAVRSRLEERGFRTEQTLVLYTMDPWKGKPAQLKQFRDLDEARRYVGWPLHRVPDPHGCCESWVEHYWHDFGDYLDEFASDVRVVATDELYSSNERMGEFVRMAVERRGEVVSVLNKYRGRRPLPESWIPFEPVCKRCGRIDSTRCTSVDLRTGSVTYECEHCGHVGEASLRNGKLAWRLEWVGVWYSLNVAFEPYGKDHATPGGSRDSCNELATAVFGLRPPLGTAFEWVGYVRGGKDLGDMGSSDFIGFTPREWVEVAEPEVLRFLYLVSRPMKRIALSLEDVPRYTDQFDRAERVYYCLEEVRDAVLRGLLKRSYELSLLRPPPKEAPFQLSYMHAVALVQTIPEGADALEEAVRRLRMTGRLKGDLDDFSAARVERRLKLAKAWLDKYAPEHYRISILEELRPELVRGAVSEPERIAELLRALRTNLSAAEWTDDGIKRAMLGIPKRKGREEREFFRALYLAFFGKPQGPRIAPYLSMLDRGFVLRRVEETIRALEGRGYE